MFGRFGQSNKPAGAEAERGFDSYDLRLGDLMRGERATLGKSLLDVQRELRIKASYIAAIENADPSAFETPGFIAGYVRSYARYLGMDPDVTFKHFCAESGFSGVHGLSAQQGRDVKRPAAAPIPARVDPSDVIASSRGPFVPQGASILSQIEPGALGSMAVLVALIGAIGYGGWSVLQEIQRVQVTPVEQAPIVAELDPLMTVTQPALDDGGTTAVASSFGDAPSTEAMDRLYRPQALDVPVLTARDAPISTIQPGELGALATALPEGPSIAGIGAVLADAGDAADETPRVLAAGPDALVVFAVRPAWVRVRAADGSILFEKILDAGEAYTVPATEVAPTLHAGNSGSVYFSINGQTYGPAGSGTSVARNVPLASEPVLTAYTVADPEADRDLATVVAQLTAPVAAPVVPATE